MNDEEYFSMDFDDSTGVHFRRPEQPLLDPPVIEVYLAGPLTNNDPEVQSDCEKVREIVKRLLHNYDYLGLRFRVYDPADVTRPGSVHSDEQVYEMDHDRTMSADLVIFHVNAPSLGVGSESQIAADATVPRVTIAKTGVAVSRMFKGIFSPSIVDITYRDCAELELTFSRNIAMIARRIVESAKLRREHMASFTSVYFGRQVFSRRILNSTPIGTLATLTDIKESWLRRLERTPVLGMCLSSMQLVRIAGALDCYLKLNDQQIPMLRPRNGDENTEEMKQSLANLIDCVLQSRTWIADEEVFRVWNRYTESSEREVEEALTHRGGETRVVSIEQWKLNFHPDSLYG